MLRAAAFAAAAISNAAPTTIATNNAARLTMMPAQLNDGAIIMRARAQADESSQLA